MRSAAATTLATTPLMRGRHRLGRPGLVHVTAFVAVVRRGLFESWRVPGRHRRSSREQIREPLRAVPATPPSLLPTPKPSSVSSSAPKALAA
jgi:hypothetical protein